jgi:hypothetical protein
MKNVITELQYKIIKLTNYKIGERISVRIWSKMYNHINQTYTLRHQVWTEAYIQVLHQYKNKK